MSELEERLNAVLSNPGEMSRIAAMAQKLMGNLPPEGAAPPDAAEAPGGGGLPGGLAGSLPGLLSRLASGQNGNGKQRLADALALYLSAERARRLSRALRIAGAVRIAGAAFSEWGRGDDL